MTAELQRSFSHTGSFKYPNLIFFLSTPDPNSIEDEIHIFQGIDCLASDILDQYNGHKDNQEKEAEFQTTIEITTPPPPTTTTTTTETTAKTIQTIVIEIDKTKENYSSHIEEAEPETNDLIVEMARGKENEMDDTKEMEGAVKELHVCIDAIEQFTVRLQRIASAEIERQKLDKSKNGTIKKKSSGDVKAKRAEQRLKQNFKLNLPKEEEFVDNFKAYKKTFNLLGKLGSRIHDPSSPELVRHIFPLLQLVVDASAGLANNRANVAGRVVYPLLTQDAKNLIATTLQSKQHEFWNSLGEAWTLRETDSLQQPTLKQRSTNTQADMVGSLRGKKAPPAIIETNPDMRYGSMYHQGIREVKERTPLPKERVRVLNERNAPASQPNHDLIYQPNRFFSDEVREEEQRLPLPRQRPDIGWVNGGGMDPYTYKDAGLYAPAPNLQYQDPVQFLQDDGDDIDKHLSMLTFYEIREDPALITQFADRMNKFERNLMENQAKVGESMYDRSAKFIQELTIHKSEIVEIMEDDKNWWFIRNWRGEDGYVPKTIITVVNPLSQAAA